MASLNKVLLIGNLTRDPELRRTTGGSAVCRMTIAVNRRFTSAQGETRDEACYIDVDVWGRIAELCAQNLRKGSSTFVEGRLRMDQWDDKTTGQKRSRLYVQADNIQFLNGSRTASMGNGGQSPFSSETNGNSFEPMDAQQNSNKSAVNMPPQPPMFEPIDIQDEDIPF